MEELKLTVGSENSGERLDKFLVEALGQKFSRSFIKKLIDEKHALVDGKHVNAHHKVCGGEAINITIPPPKETKLKAENIPLEIVYEDSDVIVINKTPGISVHPARGEPRGTLVNALLFHCRNLSGIGGVLRPGIVHRLDKDTSGLLVAAKNDASHRNLAGQFKNRRVKKKYIALVKGTVQFDNGRVELPIARRKTDVTKMSVSFTSETKKIAITHYRVLKRFKDFTMLELSIETGRTHQIRVHMSHIGYPIIGDRVYGSPKGMARQALHAKTLGFFHPGTRKFVEFDSEIPGDMKALIDKGEL